MEDLKYLLALNYVPGIGSETSKELIKIFGSAEHVWKLKLNEKLLIKGLSQKKLEQIGNEEFLILAEKEINKAVKNNIKILSFYNNDYPYLLKQCSDAPAFIFSKGNINWGNKKFVAIVGTRNMTPRGEEFVKELVSDLKNQEIVIVSGLALGVDAAAHFAAVENGLDTIGVLAHSVHEIYPRTNERLAYKMMENGGVVSTYSSFQKPQRNFFLSRNRIIAGLSDATIVVESDIKGGAMSTATHANNYNRDVFAVPGRITDKYSRGCHVLIKSHKAFLTTDSKDLLNYLNLSHVEKPKIQQPELFMNLDEQEQKIIDYLKQHGKVHIDELAVHMKKPGFQLMSILLNLEIKNLIRPLSGKNYELVF